MESLLQIDKLNTGNASLYHKSLYCKGEKVVVVKVYGLAFWTSVISALKDYYESKKNKLL